MLDKTASLTTHTTVVNATDLAVAIASKVFGDAVPDTIGDAAITRNSINHGVLGAISAKFLSHSKINLAGGDDDAAMTRLQDNVKGN